jgi:peptidoglycan/LPS O-acetylase OafA/YrhL
VLDGLRALAVLWVCTYHSFLYSASAIFNKHGFLPALFRAHVIFAGDLGVDVFFVLSGFLMTDMIIVGFTRFNYGACVAFKSF